MTEGRAMRRFAVIWPLAILFGLFSIVAWDTLSQRANHVLARDPSPAALRTSGSLASPIPQSIPSTAEPSTPLEVRIAAFVSKTMQQAISSPPSIPVVIPPPDVATPAAQVPPLAPRSIISETPTFTELGRPSGAAPSEGARRPQNCLDLWDPDTHMTKAQWKAACGRAPRNP